LKTQNVGEKKEMAKLKAGVIGTGSIGNAHLQGYTNCKSQVTIYAICDLNKTRLDEMGEKYGVPTERRYTDYKEMLAKEKLDMVSVCTWNCYHYEIATACIKAGIPTLCEKPMTIDIEDAKKLAALAKKTGVKNMVAFSHRFSRPKLAAKELLDSGKLGDPFMIRIRFAHGGPYPGWAQSDWFYDPKRCGYGALMDMGIHAIDFMHFAIGPVKRVSAMMATLRKKIKVEDNAIIVCDFGPKKKCLGYIECGWTSKPGFSGVEIYCDKGTIIVNEQTQDFQVIAGSANPSYADELEYKKLNVAEGPTGWEYQLKAWVDYVAGKKKNCFKYPIPNFEDGYKSVVVGLKAAESSKTGKTIDIK